MGNIGLGEILLIALIALLLFGPKKLPELGKAVGKGLHEFKKAMEGKEEKTEEPPPSEEKTPKTP